MSFMCDQPGTSRAGSSSCCEPVMSSYAGPGPVMSSYTEPGPVMRSLTTQTDPIENSISTQTEDMVDHSSLPDPWVLPNPDMMIDQWIENFELDDADEFNSNIRSTLIHSLSHFSQLMPEERPPLPYFPLHKTTIEIIGVLGVYLQPYLDCSHPSRTMSILYCGAIAACRLAGIDLPAELMERSTCNNPYCHLLRGFVHVQVV